MTTEHKQLTSSGGAEIATSPGDVLAALTNGGKDRSLMIIAGDVSADRHVGKMLNGLRQAAPTLHIWGGIGGDCMSEAGLELMYHLRETNVFGLIEALRVMPRILGRARGIIEAIEKRRPDVILLVDYGAFNLRIARSIRKKIPSQKIVYFISPQLWASRPWRIKTIADNVSKMLVIFPFEETLYRSYGIDARFIGHPLSQQIPDEKDLMDRESFARNYGLDPAKPIIAVLPGSRKQEIREHLPVLLKAARDLNRERPELQFVISKAIEDLGPIFSAICEKQKIEQLSCLPDADSNANAPPGRTRAVFIDGKENYNLLKNCDLVWAKSGTTTLEVAMFGKPMLILYRGDWLSFLVILLIKTVKNVGLPNILAGRTLVPELLQLDCRPQQLVRYTRDLLDVPGLRREISAELMELKRQLGQGDYIANCTEEVLAALGLSKGN